jgi:hypothetical protein
MRLRERTASQTRITIIYGGGKAGLRSLLPARQPPPAHQSVDFVALGKGSSISAAFRNTCRLGAEQYRGRYTLQSNRAAIVAFLRARSKEPDTFTIRQTAGGIQLAHPHRPQTAAATYDPTCEQVTPRRCPV